jgi:SAM-dependent methyltransferase
MLKRPVTSEDLAALRREREAADRRYNDALTALDGALVRFGDPPEPPRPFDEHQITPLNRHWEILRDVAAPHGRGLRARLSRFLWQQIGPLLDRQQAFNSAVVDHVNRNIAGQREIVSAATATLQLMRAQAAAFSALQTHLILYLQTVTLYVDTKDRELLANVLAVYDAALNGLTDELLKRWESMSAREARFSARVGNLDGAHEEMRSTIATLQQGTLVLKRELERIVSSPAAAPGEPLAAATAAPDLNSYKYVGFEDRFRGTQDDIRHRLESYVDDFRGAHDVLDVGCGRGEFLDLLRAAGIGARGLDLNHEMVEVCRARGLDVAEGDLLGYLRSLPDGSLGGLFAAQVVEHLEPSYLMDALEAAFHKLRPGSRIILETINPACWFAFFESYIRDLTHVRPIHPETLQYLMLASGFQKVEIRYRAPYPDADKLQRVAPPADGAPALLDTIETMNANAERLNRLLFTHLDYAAVAERR